MRSARFLMLVLILGGFALTCAAREAPKRGVLEAPEIPKDQRRALRRLPDDGVVITMSELQSLIQRDGDGTIVDRTISEVILCISVLVFGLVVLAFQTIIFRSRGDGLSVSAFLPLHGVTLIITAALFILVTAGYSKESFTPIVGLFGAMIGFLLGDMRKKDTPAPKDIQTE